MGRAPAAPEEPQEAGKQPEPCSGSFYRRACSQCSVPEWLQQLGSPEEMLEEWKIESWSKRAEAGAQAQEGSSSPWRACGLVGHFDGMPTGVNPVQPPSLREPRCIHVSIRVPTTLEDEARGLGSEPERCALARERPSGSKGRC